MNKSAKMLIITLVFGMVLLVAAFFLGGAPKESPPPPTKTPPVTTITFAESEVLPIVISRATLGKKAVRVSHTPKVEK